MNKFKVGDRVAAYGIYEDCSTVHGFVTAVDKSRVWISDGTDIVDYECHPKQCRKLKPKKKKLRIEGEVSWLPWEDIYGNRFTMPTESFSSSSTLTNKDFMSFVGKRTKITIEEL